MKKWLILFSSFLLAGCGYDDFSVSGDGLPGISEPPNTPISQLAGKAIDGELPVRISERIVIAGYVTASDDSGNFYKSFMIEDETGAVEIRAGIDNLHNMYRVGQRVMVTTEGLWLGTYLGVAQLGGEPANSTSLSVGSLGSRQLLERHLLRDNRFEPPIPLSVSVGQLDRMMCGRLVRTGSLRFDGEPGDTWALPPGLTGEKPKTGYVRFVNAEGAALTVVTSGYASFAGAKVPATVESLTGILQWGSTGSGKIGFTLKLRNKDDVEN